MLISGRATNILLVLILAVGVAIVAVLASGARGGPLDPPGPPSSTLPQVEPRTPIDHLPFTISQSGSYFVTKNLTGNGLSPGILIHVSNVTIDLNGFTLTGTGGTVLDGILVDNSGTTGVTVEGGVVTNWATGIALAAVDGGAIRSVEITHNVIGIQSASHSIVAGCTARGNSSVGVVVNLDTQLTGCTVTGNTLGGVDADAGAAIEHNLIEDNGATYGNILLEGSHNTVADNDLYNTSPPDIKDNGSDNVIVRNRVTSCSSIVPGVDTYAPFTKVSGAGSTAVGLVNTNVALSPNGAGLC